MAVSQRAGDRLGCIQSPTRELCSCHRLYTSSLPFVKRLKICGNLFFFSPRLCRVSHEILVPWPGIKPGPSAVRAQSPNHWTTREFPVVTFHMRRAEVLLIPSWFILHQTSFKGGPTHYSMCIGYTVTSPVPFWVLSSAESPRPLPPECSLASSLLWKPGWLSLEDTASLRVSSRSSFSLLPFPANLPFPLF